MVIIKQSHEGNSKLVLQFEGRSAFPLEYEDYDEFNFWMAEVELDLFKDKKNFTLHQARQKFSFDERKKICWIIGKPL